jgi:hypothetical protein
VHTPPNRFIHLLSSGRVGPEVVVLFDFQVVYAVDGARSYFGLLESVDLCALLGVIIQNLTTEIPYG